jgi:hypothetical protein
VGARAVTVLDWVSRGSRAALAASVAAVAIGVAVDFRWTVPLEVAVARTLGEVATPEALDSRTRAALDVDDIALARGFADLGAEIGRPLSKPTLDRLAAAETSGAVAWRTARGAARGFATGEVTDAASLGGSIAADLTLIGDVRDLIGESGKIMRGEEHSNLLLGLAAVGVAATAATVASAGVAAPVKFGVSVLKAARRAGTLTADFAAHIGRTLAGAIDAGRAARSAAAPTLRGSGEVAARTAGFKAFGGVATELRAVGDVVGPSETVQLLRFVRSGDDLAELGPFARRFGPRTRAVAELTGRASLRAFRTSIRLGAFLLAHLWAALAWFGGLLGGALSGLAWRGLRLAAARI